MILYRHPTPAAAPGLCYGRSDLSLSPQGRLEVTKALETAPPARQVITSPARRAQALGRALAEHLSAPLALDERLWELDFGSWEGRLWSEIDRAESELWSTDPWKYSPPGGESFEQLYRRVVEATANLAPGVIIVCHAGPIRALMMHHQGLTFDEAFAKPVPYAQPLSLEKASV